MSEAVVGKTTIGLMLTAIGMLCSATYLSGKLLWQAAKLDQLVEGINTRIGAEETHNAHQDLLLARQAEMLARLDERTRGKGMPSSNAMPPPDVQQP